MIAQPPGVCSVAATLFVRRRNGHIFNQEDVMRGTGRVIFAATLLLIVGTLNIIYGIGALDGANVFVNDKRYILSNLNTLGGS